MKIQFIIATGNKDKVREFQEIFTADLKEFDSHFLTMKEAGVASDPEENGTTFEENALIKAMACADLIPEGNEGLAWREAHGIDKDAAIIVLSDDSGLVIDAMNGEPGILSARYFGRETPYPEKNGKILKIMENVPEEKRTARFVAAIAAVLPDKSSLTVRGVMEGTIAHAIAGENGFGYDPIFFLPEYGMTSAEISREQKNAISHRGQGLRLMAKELQKKIGGN